MVSGREMEGNESRGPFEGENAKAVRKMRVELCFVPLGFHQPVCELGGRRVGLGWTRFGPGPPFVF